MKKLALIVAVILFSSGSLFAQKFIDRDGHIWFHSETPVETIEAHNYQATSVLDSENGEMVFAVLMKGFQFEKALMQEHFNEKYVESDKYPKGTFKGKIENLDEINFSQAGSYPAKVSGDLTIHGVTNPVEADGTIEVTDSGLNVDSKFIIAVADYEIKIPSVVRDNIAKEIEITVDMSYDPYKRNSN